MSKLKVEYFIFIVHKHFEAYPIEESGIWPCVRKVSLIFFFKLDNIKKRYIASLKDPFSVDLLVLTIDTIQF